MSRIFTPELFLVIAAILWGGTFVVIKLALDSVPPFLFLAVRFWLAGIITLFLYRKTLFSKENRRWDYILPAFFVACSALLGYAFQTIGLVYTTATQSGFMTGAYVVFVPLLQIAIERRLPSVRTWVAVLIVVIGLFMISQNGKSYDEILGSMEFGFGDGLTLIGAFFFAIYIILIDIFSKKIPTQILVSFEILLIAIVSTTLFPVESIILNQKISVQFDLKFWIGIFYTSVFATIFTTQIQARYQKAVPPARAGLLYSLEPVFSFFLAYLVLGERLGTIGAIGSGLTLFGIVFSELGKWNQRKE
ncbi:DMT family transporter [Leptospira meyeri]|uniref:DMT family transporter n=1 Tax=Leptospira meyeri TaxID=29508 RepID=UPI000C2AA7B6|nr:DMT family transporter [Leptospira meyeri]MCW7489209.1 DMT family transporter [Leptospira meyeri]PKA11741.1 permease [Leptospira meyeri]PKA25013.1 permease [Leptospira sp. mixed culture ATI2-C-A1]TGM23998.1 DMT family transporter [Leptospira meyeri]